MSGPAMNIDIREQSPVGQGMGVRLGTGDGEPGVDVAAGLGVSEAGDDAADGVALGVTSSSWLQATSSTDRSDTPTAAIRPTITAPACVNGPATKLVLADAKASSRQA